MGAGLWSFLALISLLLLSPIEDWTVVQANGQGEWLVETRKLYRRAEQSSYGGRDSCDQCHENGNSSNSTLLRVLEEEFINSSRSVQLAGPLLIHIVS